MKIYIIWVVYWVQEKLKNEEVLDMEKNALWKNEEELWDQKKGLQKVKVEEIIKQRKNVKKEKREEDKFRKKNIKKYMLLYFFMIILYNESSKNF